ncbi:MAG: hypothetical protein AB7S70_00620 [Hyphomicrobium sp.]|uniref:hypothetical protein n=1 Tax=Hyphomicrobium sp. TaxID=82 RepID=UPI003D0A6B17
MTILVRDANGDLAELETPIAPGRKAASASRPAVLSNEDKAVLDSIAGKDFATQTTLAALLAKVIAAPATETTVAAILMKLIAAPATEAKQDTGNTALAAIKTAAEALAATIDSGEIKVAGTFSAEPAEGAATEAKQDTGNTSLGSIDTKFSTLNGKDFATTAKQDALAALIGEAQSSPTANTVLDRLKTIATSLTTLAGYVDGLEALATALNGYVDGLEAKDFATSAKQDALAALVGEVQASPTANTVLDRLKTIATSLTTLAGYVDGLEALATALNGYVDGLEAKDFATSAKQDTAIASLSVMDDWDNNDAAMVSCPSSLIDVTLSLDTSAYADGDLLADTQVVTSAMRYNDGQGTLTSIQILDEDDVGQTLDLIFLSANTSLGSENSAPSVSDANARDILGRVRIASTDYIDLGGSKMATLTGLALKVKPASGTRNLYVAAIVRGAGTWTASGIRLRLGFDVD